MKKIISVIFIFAVIIVLFACDGSSGEDLLSGGTYLDCGYVAVTVPEGWQGYKVDDLTDENTTDPYKVDVYKGSDADDEMYWASYPGLQICTYSEDENVLWPDAFFYMYENTETIGEKQIGRYLFKGYTCTSLGYDMTVLWDEVNNIQITAMTNMENGSIDIDDEDVREIIKSVEIKKNI